MESSEKENKNTKRKKERIEQRERWKDKKKTNMVKV